MMHFVRRDVPSRVLVQVLGRVLRHFHYSDSAEYYLILDRVLICKQLTFFFFLLKPKLPTQR